MATIARLNVLLGLSSAPFHAGLKSAQSALRAFHVQLSTVFAHLGPFTFRMGPGAAGLVGLARGLTEVATSAVETAAKFEHMELTFAGMLGSAAKARSVLDDLFQFAATTPFTFEGVTQATQRLLAFGFSAENAVGIVKQMADVAAAMPEGIDEGLKRVTRAIGEMQAKGRVSAQEMRQLADAGIPVWDALATRIGVSVPRAMKMAENNVLSARDGIMALLDLANSPRFAGMSQRLGQSMLGLWSTFKDNVQLTMRDLGNAFIKGFDLKGATTTLTDLFGFLRSQIGALTPAIEKIGTVFRAVFDVVISMVKTAVQAFAGWTATLDNSPAGLQKLREGVIEVMRGIATGTVNAITSIANAAIDAVNELRRTFGPLLRLAQGQGGGASAIAGGLFLPGPAGPLANMALRQLQQGPLAAQGAIAPFDNTKLLNTLNALFDNLSQGGPVFFDLSARAQQFAVSAVSGLKAVHAEAVRAFGPNSPLALATGLFGKFSLPVTFGQFPKDIQDAMDKARGFEKTLEDINFKFRQLIPHEEMVNQIGVVVGAVGLLGSRLLEAKTALRHQLAQHFLDFEKDNPLLNRGDVGAMQKGSAEAASAINRAFNETRRQERDPQQRAAAILEQMNKRDAEKKRLLEEMAQALEALGVQ